MKLLRGLVGAGLSLTASAALAKTPVVPPSPIDCSPQLYPNIIILPDSVSIQDPTGSSTGFLNIDDPSIQTSKGVCVSFGISRPSRRRTTPTASFLRASEGEIVARQASDIPAMGEAKQQREGYERLRLTIHAL